MGVLTSMTLNGGVQKAGEILRDYVGGNSPTTTPTLTPTISPSSVPTRSNTWAPTKAPACKSWCKDNTLSWSQKCTWAKCSLCEPCGTSSPTASPTKNPTSLPPTSFPTANPTTTPTSSPVSGSEFCCSWNLYNCGVDSFCNLSEDNCQGSCGGTWMKKIQRPCHALENGRPVPTRKMHVVQEAQHAKEVIHISNVSILNSY